MIFVLEKDELERESMRETIARTGCAVVPLPTVDTAIALLKNQAACDLIVLSTDALDDDPGRFDQLLAARRPTPPIIIYGFDPAAKLTLHGLNKGAVDFLTKPLSDDDLIQAVENAVFTSKDAPKSARGTRAIQASSHVSGWIELTAVSELEQFRRLQRFSDALFATRLTDEVCEDLKMAVEEVGRNAVEWGNHFDPDKRVHISYCMFDDRVLIKVEDEGEGFVPESVPDPTADPVKAMKDRATAGKRPGGYGVFLIQKLVDEVVYNEKGNTVLLIKYLPEPAEDTPGGKA